MGWRFSLGHVNIVAYILAADDSSVPRIRVRELQAFLDSVRGVGGEEAFTAANEAWLGDLKRAATEASAFLRSLGGEHDAVLNEIEAIRTLAGVRRAIGRYRLTAMTVGGPGDEGAIQEIFESFVHRYPRDDTIFLYPSHLGAATARPILDVLDPFSAVALLAEQPETWPGVLFWTPRGRGAFVPAGEVEQIYLRLAASLDRDESVDDFLAGYQSKRTGKRLLHLSDLHFGTPPAARHRDYLLDHISKHASGFDRIVITGDLFDQPNEECGRDFRQKLEELTGMDAIVVPGNHDQRWLGNVGSELREMAKVQWASVVADAELRCVFFCLDSARRGRYAQGEVTR